MSRSRPFLTGVALAAILMLGAAAPAAPPPDEDPPVITLTATDFAFEAPERMPAGAVTVKLVNEGESTHHAQLVELRDGKTLDDLMAAAAEGAPPEWAVWVGGPGIAMPGMTSEATVDLRPGTYYWLCFIETDEGVPHLAEGMTHRVEVEPGPRTPLPAPDNTMMLNDYEFKLGHPVEAGHSVIRVRNYAAQPHEVVLVKLMPGKTMDDVMAFFEAGGELRFGGGYVEAERKLPGSHQRLTGYLLHLGLGGQVVWWLSRDIGLVVPALQIALLTYEKEGSLHNTFDFGIRAGLQLRF